MKVASVVARGIQGDGSQHSDHAKGQEHHGERDAMVNEGEQSLKVMKEGATTDITFQITYVRRLCCSLGKICDRQPGWLFSVAGEVSSTISPLEGFRSRVTCHPQFRHQKVCEA